ncbi:hypothetical protein B1L02_09810 [Pseudoalteromonas piscicida]|uniref:Uncharacterized protein n=1 Tax=Pseudoalteromonas piscicida TaxID=43662 RepID=A0AAD0RI42_PSEO7|nr:hypothetical protein B1L02_09810 [Pseudoalteromonas piscicida]AXR02005.1 hypothetical protein D0511_07955 [Pseudoalteromonas piscicida]
MNFIDIRTSMYIKTLCSNATGFFYVRFKKPREVNSLLPQHKHSAIWWEVVYPPMACNEVLAKKHVHQSPFQHSLPPDTQR